MAKQNKLPTKAKFWRLVHMPKKIMKEKPEKKVKTKIMTSSKLPNQQFPNFITAHLRFASNLMKKKATYRSN